MARPWRVLITGASGFIGANLVRAEIAAGNEVHLLLRQEAQPWRLADLAGQFVVYQGDLTRAVDVRRAVEACRPEIIYHLAACGVSPTASDRATLLAANLTGTVNLLDALAGRDFLGMVHAGSSAEYGHKNAPMRESDRLDPRSDYAVTKAAATLFCQAEAFRGAPISTIRLFNVYGPWEAPSRLVPYVMGCCAAGQSPQVSSGRQGRDFIYVADVVELLQRAVRHPAARGRILNAGTGRQHRVAEMVETILQESGTGVRATYGAVPNRPDEPLDWVADVSLAQELLGWSARYDLQAGVRATWQWYRARSLCAA